MQQIVIHRPGGYDRLRLEQHPDPRPGPGEALVDVRAVGVNFADVVVRMGLYASAKKYVGWPITPGFELAGRVAALGEGVGGLAVGDPVFGVTRFGAYADRVVVPAGQLFPRPPALTEAQAAAFPTVFLTGLYALDRLVSPGAGAVLLVHSAAGGVGSALVQLSKARSCRVIAVVGGAHKVAVARALGVDQVIDKSAADLWATVRRLCPAGLDAVFDANGAPTLRQSYQHLRPTGRLVAYGFHGMLPRRGGRPSWPRRGGRPSWPRLIWSYLRTPRFNPLEMTQSNRSVLAFNLSYLFEQQELLHEAMATLLGLLAEGAIQPPAVTTYPLAEVARAHRDLESGQTTGKLVLVP